MVRSSLQNGLFAGIGHYLNASLGIQLMKLHMVHLFAHLLPWEDKLAAIQMDIRRV